MSYVTLSDWDTHHYMGKEKRILLYSPMPPSMIFDLSDDDDDDSQSLTWDFN
jgi:hypothetical protein